MNGLVDYKKSLMNQRFENKKLERRKLSFLRSAMIMRCRNRS